jgi:hypothetical protein
MSVIFSYVLRYDDGAAPNPFWNTCTLTICKPAIRRKAKIGDWVIGTGSANAICNDMQRRNFNGQLVYAMKVSRVMSLKEYDTYCQRELANKIPEIRNEDWRRRMGDCIYHYENGDSPRLRPGVHGQGNVTRDLSGLSALLSDHFYYFGEQPKPLPANLLPLVKKGQGHRKILSVDLAASFEGWIQRFSLNVVAADPQLRHAFDGAPGDTQLGQCGICHLDEDSSDEEDVIC